MRTICSFCFLCLFSLSLLFLCSCIYNQSFMDFLIKTLYPLLEGEFTTAQGEAVTDTVCSFDCFCFFFAARHKTHQYVRFAIILLSSSQCFR